MKAVALLAMALSLGCAGCLRASLTPPAEEPGPITLTIACPAPALGSLVWRCTGTPSDCTLTSRNWIEVGVIVGASGEWEDSTAQAAAEYTYTGLCTDGSIIAPPSNFVTESTEEE
jgi:hypothetical protein